LRETTGSGSATPCAAERTSASQAASASVMHHNSQTTNLEALRAQRLCRHWSFLAPRVLVDRSQRGCPKILWCPDSPVTCGCHESGSPVEAPSSVVGLAGCIMLRAVHWSAYSLALPYWLCV
jgi:hypothetical protein